VSYYVFSASGLVDLAQSCKELLISQGFKQGLVDEDASMVKLDPVCDPVKCEETI